MKAYMSVNKLVSALKKFNPPMICVIFPVEHVSKGLFDTVNISPIGILLGKECLNTDAIREIFGRDLVVSIHETKTRKVLDSPYQILRIDPDEKEFEGNTYHISTIHKLVNAEKLCETLMENYTISSLLPEDIELNFDEIEFMNAI